MLPWRNSGFECSCGGQSDLSVSSSTLESKQLENSAQSVLLTDLLASTHIVGGYSQNPALFTPVPPNALSATKEESPSPKSRQHFTC